MGWGSGSSLFRELIDILMEEVPSITSRSRIYSKMIQAFEDMDCDTLQECLEIDTIFDLVFIQKNPDWNE